jgi:hypothetical protein
VRPDAPVGHGIEMLGDLNVELVRLHREAECAFSPQPMIG